MGTSLRVVYSQIKLNDYAIWTWLAFALARRLQFVLRLHVNYQQKKEAENESKTNERQNNDNILRNGMKALHVLWLHTGRDDWR